MRRVRMGLSLGWVLKSGLLIFSLGFCELAHAGVFGHLQNGQPVLEVDSQRLLNELRDELSVLAYEEIMLQNLSLSSEDFQVVFSFTYTFRDLRGNHFRAQTLVPLIYDEARNVFSEDKQAIEEGRRRVLTCLACNCSEGACEAQKQTCTTCGAEGQTVEKESFCKELPDEVRDDLNSSARFLMLRDAIHTVIKGMMERG